MRVGWCAECSSAEGFREKSELVIRAFNGILAGLVGMGGRVAPSSVV